MNKTMILKIFFYFFGFFITAFGVNSLIRSDLGAGPWDTVTYNLSQLVDPLTIGRASMIVNAVLVALLLMANKKRKYVITVIPIIAIGLFIDLWDLVLLRNLVIPNVGMQVVFFVLGVYFITLGLAIVIHTKFPAMIFDELTFTIMRVVKSRSFFKVRIFVEMFAITLATILGFTAGIRFGAVNVGSILIAFTIGPLINAQIIGLRQIITKVQFR